jgi:hypothetical protein
MSNTNIICITPIKNESWILRNFLECAKRWADIVIIGDNRSGDDSVSIARSFGCPVIDLGPAYDEANRRRLLIEEARKIPGRRLIVSIDADEMLSANWATSAEWPQMLTAPAGTRFHFDWVELLPGLDRCTIATQPAAFIDDGSPYNGVTIHSPRIPQTKVKAVKLEEIKLLHYINIEPERMLSRHRWYKCLELIEHKKRAWETCVRYQDVALKTYDTPIVAVKDEWLQGYEWLDQFRTVEPRADRSYWWDSEVLNFFDRYGIEKFRKLNIWDVDWNAKATYLGRNSGSYRDPRRLDDKLMHNFITRYREELKLKRRLPFKIVDKLAKTALRPTGW